MSTTVPARALGIPEVVAQVFAHLPEPDCWNAASVSLVWWEVAQHEAYLRRGTVCSDPDSQLIKLLEALLSGPKSAGMSVKHVNLGTGVQPGAAVQLSRRTGSPALESLNPYNSFVICQVLKSCPNVVSISNYGLDQCESAEDVIDLFKKYANTNKLESLHLIGTVVNLTAFGWQIEFPGLRHLTLTGLPSSAINPYAVYDPSSSSFGFDWGDMDYDPPALALESLTLTNVGRRQDENRRQPGNHVQPPPDGLPGSAMTWLIQAAKGQPGVVGLRHLRYRLVEIGQGTRLSSEAVAAIAQHASELERVELWLTPENVNNDLQAILGLTQQPKLFHLKLGLFVPTASWMDGPRGASPTPARTERRRLEAKLNKQVAALDDDSRAKVTLLD